MPKKALVLNGFLGGINIDSDASDLPSEGRGKDQAVEIKNMLSDYGGKVRTGLKDLVAIPGGIIAGSVDDSADSLLIFNNKYYREAGLYKVGSDVAWSGKFTMDPPPAVSLGGANGTDAFGLSVPQGIFGGESIFSGSTSTGAVDGKARFGTLDPSEIYFNSVFSPMVDGDLDGHFEEGSTALAHHGGIEEYSYIENLSGLWYDAPDVPTGTGAQTTSLTLFWTGVRDSSAGDWQVSFKMTGLGVLTGGESITIWLRFGNQWGGLATTHDNFAITDVNGTGEAIFNCYLPYVDIQTTPPDFLFTYMEFSWVGFSSYSGLTIPYYTIGQRDKRGSVLMKKDGAFVNAGINDSIVDFITQSSFQVNPWQFYY